MRVHNRMGTRIVDLGFTTITDGTAFTASTNHDLVPRLDTANLGANYEAYTDVLLTVGSQSIAAGSQVACGVGLAPLSQIGNGKPIHIEVSGGVSCYALTPKWFIGFADSAATLGNGWDEDNAVTEFAIIESDFCCNECVCLKDVVSGGLDTDLYVIAGFFLDNQSSASVDVGDVRYSIYAGYATGRVDTIDTMR